MSSVWKHFNIFPFFSVGRISDQFFTHFIPKRFLDFLTVEQKKNLCLFSQEDEEASSEDGDGDESLPPGDVNAFFPDWERDSLEMVGNKVRVYWDGDNEWYKGRLVRFKPDRKKQYQIRY